MAAHPRPLSPHLQVYTQPLTAGAMSIFHRITGALLAVGAFLLPAWLLSVAGGSEAFARFGAFAGSWPGIVALAIGAVALVYHLLNGVRHLFWDMGKGFGKDRAHATGLAVLALAVVLSAALVFAGLRAGGLA
jgi:succinate dehydrogenase / fumarate reductase cytochrome b subunit